MQLVITPAGTVRTLYDETIDLALLGQLTIARGSHVEPDAHGRWFADLAPVAGPKLGPFPRKYVFMPLSKESPVLAAPNSLRTVSPGVSGNAPTPISNQVSHTPMAKTTPPAAANSAPTTTEAQAPAEQKRPKKVAPSSLDQAIALRTALREATNKTNELVQALKRDQRQQRIVKETLRSLKQLQAA